MKTIFLDANILFSGAKKESHLRLLLDLLSPKYTLVTSEYAFEEARRNIEKKRPQWRDGFTEVMQQVQAKRVNPKSIPSDLPVVEKDKPILAAAIQNNSDYLLTGDRKDFGHLFGTMLRRTKILSIREAAEELLEG